MERDMLGISIAASPVRAALPADKSLTERLQFAMRYVRDHERALFWMVSDASDDLKFRTAIAAVMLEGSEHDKDILTRSMKPLRMLAAASQGIPVDFGAMAFDDDMLPLMKLWAASEPSSAAALKDAEANGGMNPQTSVASSPTLGAGLQGLKQTAE